MNGVQARARKRALFRQYRATNRHKFIRMNRAYRERMRNDPIYRAKRRAQIRLSVTAHRRKRRGAARAKHLTMLRQYGKKYYRRNRTRILARQRLQESSEQYRMERTEKVKRDKEAEVIVLSTRRCNKARWESNKNLTHNHILRNEVIAAYGGKCQCCGEKEPMFLTVDHVNNDGAAHKRRIGRGRRGINAWLKANGFPKKGFRILCYNCNCGRYRNGGVCPHKDKKHKLHVA